jgi:chaperonin GroES
MSDIMPLHGNVLVRLIEPEDTTKSGLVIPQSAQRDTNEGIIVRVGEGRRLDNGEIAPPRVAAGDHVLWRSGASIVDVRGDDERSEELILIDERSLVGRKRRFSDEPDPLTPRR